MAPGAVGTCRCLMDIGMTINAFCTGVGKNQGFVAESATCFFVLTCER